jgi:hypothetical protein
VILAGDLTDGHVNLGHDPGVVERVLVQDTEQGVIVVLFEFRWGECCLLEASTG